ncbi:MAG: hypothetical protein V4550_18350 [Gemmatimonadota bacterium]
MKKLAASREWVTFLRVPEPSTTDKVPALEPAWCQARGINPAAPVVIRLLRNEVLPLVRYLERKRGLVGYHFLVHDRQSGVPTTEDDRGAYIHLRLVFKKAINLKVASNFGMTRPATTGQTEIGGVDLSLIPGGLKTANQLLNAQSAWVLAFIEAHAWKDDADMVRQTRQYLHFFANMLQINVG